MSDYVPPGMSPPGLPVVSEVASLWPPLFQDKVDENSFCGLLCFRTRWMRTHSLARSQGKRLTVGALARSRLPCR